MEHYWTWALNFNEEPKGKKMARDEVILTQEQRTEFAKALAELCNKYGVKMSDCLSWPYVKVHTGQPLQLSLSRDGRLSELQD